MRQEERHIENSRHLEKMDNDIEELKQQPCKTHEQVKDALSRHDKWIWFLVTAILITAVKASFF